MYPNFETRIRRRTAFQLRYYCREHDVKGFSDKKKEDLIKLILKNNIKEEKQHRVYERERKRNKQKLCCNTCGREIEISESKIKNICHNCIFNEDTIIINLGR